MPNAPAARASARDAARKSRRPRGALARFGDPVERQRQQRVAREDRGRFAERLVVARASPAEVVVVHRGQVVVNQRVAVHQLDGAAREQHVVIEGAVVSAAASASSGRMRLPGASSE